MLLLLIILLLLLGGGGYYGYGRWGYGGGAGVAPRRHCAGSSPSVPARNSSQGLNARR